MALLEPLNSHMGTNPLISFLVGKPMDGHMRAIFRSRSDRAKHQHCSHPSYYIMKKWEHCCKTSNYHNANGSGWHYGRLATLGIARCHERLEVCIVSLFVRTVDDQPCNIAVEKKRKNLDAVQGTVGTGREMPQYLKNQVSNNNAECGLE